MLSPAIISETPIMLNNDIVSPNTNDDMININITVELLQRNALCSGIWDNTFCHKMAYRQRSMTAMPMYRKYVLERGVALDASLQNILDSEYNAKVIISNMDFSIKILFMAASYDMEFQYILLVYRYLLLPMMMLLILHRRIL